MKNITHTVNRIGGSGDIVNIIEYIFFTHYWNFWIQVVPNKSQCSDFCKVIPGLWFLY